MGHQARRLIAEVHGLSTTHAEAVHTRYMREYGTALRGLEVEHGVTPDTFFSRIHDVDYGVVKPNPVLHEALSAIPASKHIFTNGRVDHAVEVLTRLGCLDAFDGIFDIVAADYTPKPSPEPYHKITRTLGVAPEATLFIDDVPNNLRPADALGMTTVWVRNESEFSHGCVAEHVHIIADDLVPWLRDATRTSQTKRR